MKILEALEIILELSHQNRIDKEENPQEFERQEEAWDKVNQLREVIENE